MKRNKSAKRTKPAKVIVFDLNDLNGSLKEIGGSRSDGWNNLLVDQMH